MGAMLRRTVSGLTASTASSTGCPAILMAVVCAAVSCAENEGAPNSAPALAVPTLFRIVLREIDSVIGRCCPKPSEHWASCLECPNRNHGYGITEIAL